MNRILLRCAVLIGSSLTVTARPAPAPAQTVERPFTRDLDAFVERIMAAELSPGLAVAIVQDDRVTYLKGFGYADRERGRRVTPDTQFYIASTTKSFTALAGAALAVRGALDLDEPVSRALPNAKWHGAVAPDQIRLRDLLTHTHGLAPGGPVDFRTAFTGDFDNDALPALLVHHGAASTGRAFVYSNLGYNMFGLVLDRRDRSGWKGVVQREVFEPLGMQSTTAWTSKGDADRMAQPYGPGANGMSRVDYAKRDENMQAAGGHLSTASDLSRYLVAHLNRGRVGGRQAIPEAAIVLTQRMQAEQRRQVLSFQRMGWGLGWDIESYDGHTVVRRNGGFSGFSSHISFMPQRRLGVVVLANAGGLSDLAADAIETFVYDHPVDGAISTAFVESHVRAFDEALIRGREMLAKERATRASRPQVTPRPLDAYAGIYESPALGRMTWTVEDGRLAVRMGVAQSRVEVFNSGREQFRVEFGGSGFVVTFRADSGDGAPKGLEFLGQEFTRVPRD